MGDMSAAIMLRMGLSIPIYNIPGANFDDGGDLEDDEDQELIDEDGDIEEYDEDIEELIDEDGDIEEYDEDIEELIDEDGDIEEDDEELIEEEEKISKMKVNELKAALAKRSAPTDGLKDVLVARLIDVVTAGNRAAEDDDDDDDDDGRPAAASQRPKRKEPSSSSSSSVAAPSNRRREK
jgi:hypothetical protein